MAKKQPNEIPKTEPPAGMIPYKDLPNTGFQKGHKLAKGGNNGGAGRKPNVVKELERALINNPKDITTTWRKMVELAHAGNVQAIELHLNRTLGKQRAEVLDLADAEGGKRVTIVIE